MSSAQPWESGGDRFYGPQAGARFRNRLLRGDLLLGSMVKTPTVHATEILAAVGFDFLVIDQEHAPFDMTSLDQLALASHAGGIASLVRVADAAPSRILAVLDMGFAGVIVPHISTPEDAKAIVAACHYATGHRGYSASSRAGAYGAKSMRDHIQDSDASTTVIAMIEDTLAVDAAEAIARVEGIDAILIGRADLAVAMGADSTQAPEVVAAVSKVLDTCKNIGRRVMLYVGSVDEAAPFIRQAASLFISGSDQSMIRSAAQDVRGRFPPQARSSG